MSKPEVFCSFICPVYNREKYLKKAIDSILSQTKQDFELIIVNDGSTDKSEDIIKSYNSQRISYFKKEHQGCWKTKNFAITQAKGEYLCFIDSDDFISVDYLEKAKMLIKRNPFYDYYYPTKLLIVREDASLTNSIWRYLDYPLNQRSNLIKLFWERQIGGIPHAGAFIKRDVFERFGLYDEFFNLSDTAYIIKNAVKIRFCLLSELLFYYNRQHNKQTNQNTLERNKTFSIILKRIIQDYPSVYFLNKDYNKDSAEFLRICTDKFMSLACQNQENQSYLEQAKEYLLKLRSIDT